MSEAAKWILIYLGTGFALFLVLRLFWLWYWKINTIVALLRSIDESLHQLPAVRQHDHQKQIRRAS